MQSLNRFLYGPTPEEKVKAWQNKLRQETRLLDREMRQVGAPQPIHISQLTKRQLDLATTKVRASVKQLAQKGDVKSARILAREVVRSDKQKDRISVSKARLGSIGTQLNQQMGALALFCLYHGNNFHQIAMMKITGSLQKSTEIMKLSNALIKLPQISQTMREMSMEMTKARFFQLA